MKYWKMTQRYVHVDDYERSFAMGCAMHFCMDAYCRVSLHNLVGVGKLVANLYTSVYQSLNNGISVTQTTHVLFKFINLKILTESRVVYRRHI